MLSRLNAPVGRNKTVVLRQRYRQAVIVAAVARWRWRGLEKFAISQAHKDGLRSIVPGLGIRRDGQRHLKAQQAHMDMSCHGQHQRDSRGCFRLVHLFVGMTVAVPAAVVVMAIVAMAMVIDMAGNVRIALAAVRVRRVTARVRMPHGHLRTGDQYGGTQ